MTKKISNVNEIKNQLKSLNDKKIELLNSLVGMEDEFNSLTSLANTSEEWVNGLSIKSLKDIDNPIKSNDGSNRSCLGDLRKRAKLRKTSIESLSQLDKINAQIRMSKLDLLTAKVDSVLEGK